MKKILSVLVLIILTITLTGCETYKNAQLFKDVAENMKNQKNFNVTTAYKMSSQDMKMNMEMDMDVDLESEKEGLIYYNMTVGMNVMQQMIDDVKEGYIILDETEVTKHILYEQDGEEKVETTTIASDQYFETTEDVMGYEPTVFKVLKEGSKIEYIKDGMHDGVEVSIYEIKLDEPNIINGILGEDINFLSTFNIDEDDLEEYYDDMVYRVYIDSENKLLRKIEIDMKEVMKTIVSEMEENIMSPQFFEVTVSVEFKDFGNVKVEVPNELK